MTRHAVPLVFLLTLPACAADLKGYVFREADGGPPRRPLTVELSQDGKIRHRKTTEADGSFAFSRVAPGRYVVASRSGDFVFVRDFVLIFEPGPNFAAVMIPKRRAGTRPFATVSIDQLASRSKETQKKLKDAAKQFDAGDLAGAARLYEAAAELSPSAEVLHALALVYIRQGRKPDAYRTFERAIEKDPKFLFPYAHLAAVYLDERKFKEVADIAERALAEEPLWPSGHLLLGEALAGLGQHEMAVRHALYADRIMKGKSAEPHLLLAKIRWAQKNEAQYRHHLARYLDLRTSAREDKR